MKKESTATTPIDLTKLEDVAGGDSQFIADLLNTIIDNLPGQIDAIVAAHRAGDWPEVARQAHHAFATAIYSGSEELQSLLKSIDCNAGDESRRSRLQKQVERIEPVGHGVIRELNAVVEKLGAQR